MSTPFAFTGHRKTSCHLLLTLLVALTTVSDVIAQIQSVLPGKQSVQCADKTLHFYGFGVWKKDTVIHHVKLA